MNRTMLLGYLATATLLLAGGVLAHAQPAPRPEPALDARQQRIVAISAFTATGNLPALRHALQEGLAAGLTVNEGKEILVQLYAYTGFPRSLNALTTLMNLLNERRASGISDPPGRAPSPLPTDKTTLALGAENQTRLVGAPVKGEVYAFAPVMDQFLKEHLFADVFGRDNLDWKTRELVTIAALAAMGNVANQLRSHFNVGLHNGLTPEQLTHVVALIRRDIGPNQGTAADSVLATVLKKPPGNVAMAASTTLFPKGERITNSNFVGEAWLHQMVLPDSLNPVQVGSVTFAPGARSNWHLHPAGQILLITDGTGYYQEQGQAKRIIRKGDVVNCPPNVPHWHGASHTETMIQVAVTNTRNGPVRWLKPVSDEEYNAH